MALKSLDFREKRKASWEMLEKLLSRIESKGLHSLQPEELLHLAKLYRTTCSSLYIARNISLDKNLHEYLENLVSKGYLAIYCTKPVMESAFRRFFLHDFPQLVHKYMLFHVAAFLLMMAGLLIGYFAVQSDSAYYYTFVDRSLAAERTPYSSKQQLADALKGGRDTDAAVRTTFASQLFTHNTKVGFLCFTLGIVLGLPTIYLLFQNGAMLGAMSCIYHNQWLASSWWAWILPHGITELLAIILCGGAGLMIASSLIYPGKYGRTHQLKLMGRDAGLTVMGTVALFFIAGLIEGYFRQTDLPDLPRYMLAFTTFCFWLYYFVLLPGSRHGKKV